MSETNVNLINGRFQPNQIAGGNYAGASGCGALRTAKVEPDGLELTRAGRRFRTGQAGAITGIAPVQAMPTTAAQWTLFNTSTTDSMVIDSIGVQLASGTAGAGILVAAAFFTTPAQSGLGTNIVAVNASGGSQRASAVAIKSGVTITAPTAPKWFVVANSASPHTAILSVAAVNDLVQGRLIIPPLTGLALATLSPAGTSPLYFPLCQWTEFALDNE